MDGFADDNAAGCIQRPPSKDTLSFLKAETLKVRRHLLRLRFNVFYVCLSDVLLCRPLRRLLRWPGPPLSLSFPLMSNSLPHNIRFFSATSGCFQRSLPP
eukprot:4433769-Pyramimonas_sp.AAC.2